MNNMHAFWSCFWDLYPNEYSILNNSSSLQRCLQNLLFCCSISTIQSVENDEDIPQFHDQYFNFDQIGFYEPIMITWDINKLLNSLSSQRPKKYTRALFDREFKSTLKGCLPTFDEIVEKGLVKKYKHQSDKIVLLYVPFINDYIYADGKHKYMESVCGLVSRYKRLKVICANADDLVHCLSGPENKATYALIRNLTALVPILQDNNCDQFPFLFLNPQTLDLVWCDGYNLPPLDQ